MRIYNKYQNFESYILDANKSQSIYPIKICYIHYEHVEKKNHLNMTFKNFKQKREKHLSLKMLRYKIGLNGCESGKIRGK